MTRRILGLSVVAAMLGAASAAVAAPGLSLSWQSCRGEGTGTSNRAFACDVNTGANEVLVCSFELPHAVAQVSGNEVVLDVLTQAATLPAWWDFRNAGSCRTTSLGFNLVADPNNVVCADWAQGASAGGIAAYAASSGGIDPSLLPKHRRLKIALAVPPNALQDLVAATEYFACNLTINHLKTVGTGSCAGCAEPMCILLNSLNVTTPVLANNVFMGTASAPGSNVVTWQGPGPNCLAVPTKNTTWGEVKGLHR
jgi:hypothetical protein